MTTLGRQVLVFLILPLSCFWLLEFSTAKLVQEEVDALQEIVTTLGSTYWKFDAVSCKIEMVGLTTVPPTGSDNDLVCECFNGSEADCHVVRIRLKGYNLPGVLPPQLVKLPHLREIDLVYNYINGSIPREWAAMPLTNISLMVNRLSGEIPKDLGNITSLRYLSLEANQFSGSIPTELGDLVNLDTLMLSSNQFTGNLPISLARLKNLTDFRINDNNFNGTIPGFIQNWRKLERLEMHASGLEGPIPSNISQLDKLIQLRISDIGGPLQKFPQLNSATSLLRLVLRSCNLVGELPGYLWTLDELEMLDVSFNNLVGEIPSTITAEKLRFIFLTGNLLSGDIPDSILMSGVSVDLAYNNFTHQGPTQHACRDNMNMNLNLYQSSSALNNLRPDLPCMKTFSCPRYSNCLHINSGGKDISVKENKTTYLYTGDGDVEGGTAAYFLNTENFWGFTSTGDFMDDNNFQNARYIASLQSSNLSELYSTARISPISLSYFHYCLENGKYTVTLHFAEIQFTNDKSYNSLGRRIFDIYIQERLVWKNFNIQDEVHSAQTPFLLPIRDVNVTNNMLEVRLYFAGRGTTRIPARGVYGPIISALSVVSDLKACSTKKEKKTIYVVVGIIGASCVILTLLGILWWKGYFPNKRAKGKENDPDLPTGTFSLRQINAATNEFDPTNKIGEGGFGPVYKGILSDGTAIAVKQLSDTSKQGNREFLNEIAMISCLKHPNLVKLHGFCVEGDQLLLVYEFMENNNLASALFGDSHKLDWPTRHRICMGIARGLAFLHEESRLKIVHRDIKATNVLLDKNLNPKISDFGLARLHEEEKSHISTRIAGTIGYMAPEYALWGYLTYKVDVYSFGVVVLEIVSGKNNNSYMPINNCVCLLDWACNVQQSGSLLDIVDETLKSRINEEEAETMIKIALLCTNASPALRPTMSEVVSMLEGQTAIPELVPAASTYAEDLRFKAMRDLKREGHDQSTSRSQTRSSTGVHTFPSSSTSSALDHDMYEINPISDFIRPKRSDAANAD